jgi:hypothetical protein
MLLLTTVLYVHRELQWQTCLFFASQFTSTNNCHEREKNDDEYSPHTAVDTTTSLSLLQRIVRCHT